MRSEFRTPRTLASWFEFDYFRRRTLFRGMWGGLPLLMGFASIFLLGFLVWAGGKRTFQAGPLTPPHAAFNDRCDLCHQDHGATFTRTWKGDSVSSVPDSACKSCHAGSPHHANATQDHCVRCHKEHHGHEALVRIGDPTCVACHGDLLLANGSRSQISAFTEGKHPSFPISGDPGTIRFNHQSHLTSKTLRGVELRLDCADCHQLDVAGRRLLPVSYEEHCKQCHPITMPTHKNLDPGVLEATASLAKQSLPHPRRGQTSQVVRASIRDRLAEFIAAPGRERLLQATKQDRRLPLPAEAEREEREYLWVQRATREAERILFTSAGGCQLCHTAVTQGDALTIQASNVPSRWWHKADFRHDAHRAMRCQECHEADASEKSSDVLLPSMGLCLQCHDRAASPSLARSDCIECHRYHDPLQQQSARQRGTWTIEELLHKGK